MARPTTARGSKLLIKLGDAATPEVFTAPCALTTKAFNRSASVNEFNIGDCDTPDDPMWTERVISALSSTISGSGTLAQESLAAYEAFFADPDGRNVQVVLNFATSPKTYQGKYVMTTFNITGEQDGLIQVELELQSSGIVEEV